MIILLFLRHCHGHNDTVFLDLITSLLIFITALMAQGCLIQFLLRMPSAFDVLTSIDSLFQLSIFVHNLLFGDQITRRFLVRLCACELFIGFLH
jgi:hypothetical protein